MNVPLTVHVVRSRSEFDAVMECQWAGFTGQDKFWDVWFPVDKTAYLGNPQPDMQGAVAESQERMWAEHRSDPSSSWIYITEDGRRIGQEEENTEGGETKDTTTGKSKGLVVGSCQWRVYLPPKNPFPTGKVPKIKNPAWIGDEIAEEATTEIIGLIATPRTNYMGRPHAGLSWMAVRPTHRRKGIGRALMEWGHARADEAGLEASLEASQDGQQLYSNCGWRGVGVFDGTRIPVDDADEERASKKSAFLRYFGFDKDYSFTSMWRPPGGVWPEDVPAVEVFRRYHKIPAEEEA